MQQRNEIKNLSIEKNIEELNTKELNEKITLLLTKQHPLSAEEIVQLNAARERQSILIDETFKLESMLTQYSNIENNLIQERNKAKPFFLWGNNSIKKLKKELNEKARKIASFLAKMDKANDDVVETRFTVTQENGEKTYNSVGKHVTAILEENHNLLYKNLANYQSHLQYHHTNGSLHVANSEKMENALKATNNALKPLAEKPTTLTNYKSSINNTLTILNQSEEGQTKTNIQLIAQEKDPAAIRVVKAVATVVSSLAIVGLGYIATLVHDSKKNKGTINFLASEGRTVSHAKKQVEKNLDRNRTITLKI